MRAITSNTLLVDRPAGESARGQQSSSRSVVAAGPSRSSPSQPADRQTAANNGQAAESYQRILVCFKDPERDHGLLKYAGVISRAAGAREVHVLHVHPGKAVGSSWTANGVSIVGRSISSTVLRKLATEHFKGHGQEKIQCPVVHGSPTVGILRYAYDHEMDLILIGRPTAGPKAGREESLAGHVARRSTCSVLVVPSDSRPRCDRILVPVRDSECSAKALATACRMAAAIQADVISLNVYQVRSGYLTVGTSLGEQIHLLGRWAERICRELLDRVNTDAAQARITCRPDLYHKPAKIILDEITGEAADMVMIGARRRTRTADMLLSKVTDQLIRRSTVPVLSVKKKGECIGMLKAVLTLVG
jgi:nucleotide-binding universal stress UspA family protein